MRCVLMGVLLTASASLAAAQTWMPVGPTGGDVRALAADPARPQRVYLGTSSSTFYRSDDGGESWNRSRFPVQGSALDDIVVGNNGAVFVGYWEISGRGGGVARSDDGGRSFAILEGVAGQSVRALAICPANRQVIAAGTLTGVFLSENGGRSWRRITPEGHPDLRNVESIAFDPNDPRSLYVGTWHLGWRTTDGGASWVPMHQGMQDDSDVMTLTVDPRDPRTLYATACTGIYRASRPDSPWVSLMKKIPEVSRRTRAFALGDADAQLLLAGTTQGLWISEDRGAHWRRVSSPELVINTMLVRPDGTILLGTEESGVLRSADRGQTWTASNDGFTERFVTRMLFDERARRLVIAVRGDARHGGVFATSSVRGPWERLGEGLEGRQVLSLALLGGTLFAGTDQGMFQRGPRATLWSPMPMRLDNKIASPRVTELIAQRPDGLLAATSQGLIRTRDGQRWTRPTLEAGDQIWGLAVSPLERDRIVVATSRGFFRSADAGVTWKWVSPPLENVTPHELAFLPTDDQVIFATTSAGLYRSDDRAATWHPVAGGIPRSDLMGIAIHPDGRTMCVGNFTYGGIFRSADGGATWKRMAIEGLASDRVWTLGFDPTAPEWLLVSASSGGLHLLIAQ